MISVNLKGTLTINNEISLLKIIDYFNKAKNLEDIKLSI